MALSPQQQREATPITAPKTVPGESALAAFWREVIVENPIYHRGRYPLVVLANLSPEKAEAHREKLRASYTKQQALTPRQKVWRSTYPYLITFALTYVLLPIVLRHGGGSGGGLVGPLVSGLFLSAISTGASIVGEREKRTWNALLLSRLTPAQILGGKIAPILRTSLFSLAFISTIGLAFVVRGLISPTILFLLPLVLLPNSLLSILVGVEASLWSTSLKEATSRAMWRVGGLNILAFLLCLAAIVVALGIAPALLWLAPVLYGALSLVAIRRIWRRMLRSLWEAPKDFSG